MFPDTPKTLLKKISELAQGDDRAEWAAFVELYEPPLTQFIRLQDSTLSAMDVEDVVQDVFVRLVTVLREGKIDRSKAKFRSFLSAMTRRILIDRYRAAQVRPQLQVEEGILPDELDSGVEKGEKGASASGVDSLDPGARVDILWRLASHKAARDHVLTKTALSEQSKRIYELLEQGVSSRDIAAQLGVSRDVVKQVKSRIDRAIAAMERRL